MIGIIYFAWMGSIYLFMMSMQDYLKKMKIDDRFNWFMMGIAISLMSHFNRKWWYLIAIVFLSVIIKKLTRLTKIYGEGDISALGWAFIGFGIINPFYPMVYYVLFVIASVVFLAIKKLIEKVYKIEDNLKLPFIPVMMIVFIATCLILGLY